MMKSKNKMSKKLAYIFMLIMLLLLICIEVILYHQNKNRIINETKTTMLHVNDSLTTQMDSIIHTMDYTAIQVINDSGLLSNWNNYAKGINYDSSKSYLKTKLINELRKNTMIRRIVIYDQDGNCFYTGSFDADTEKIKKRADDLVASYDFDGDYTRVLISQDRDYWYSINTSQVVSLIRPLTFDGQVYSFLEVDIKAMYMNFFYENADSDGMTTQNVILWGGKKEIFMNNYDGEELDYEDLISISGIYQRIQEKNNCMVAVGRSSYYDCVLLAILNKEYIFKEIRKILLSTLWIILFLVCLGIVFLSVLSIISYIR